MPPVCMVQSCVGWLSTATHSVRTRLPRGSLSHRLVASIPLSAQTVTCTRSLQEKKLLFSNPSWIRDMTLFHRIAAGLTPPEDTRLLLS